jgi:hypothetical protein
LGGVLFGSVGMAARAIVDAGVAGIVDAGVAGIVDAGVAGPTGLARAAGFRGCSGQVAGRAWRRSIPLGFSLVFRANGGRIHHPGEDQRSGAVLGEQAFEEPDDGLAILAGEVCHDTHHPALRTTRGDEPGRHFESALQFSGGAKRDGVGHVGSIRMSDGTGHIMFVRHLGKGIVS